ncbi:terminal uridylyltransferase Tailor-like [Trichogramma pretiosum]|uniref:terminal uridylyltransferase Tailor-like n=1 Tax=Trichogramma pretiosum TaxID=7493 RepID=UPI000C71A224|nr:terminal uridylyltransferase Tailor-like [Trichogramma pretiosum]
MYHKNFDTALSHKYLSSVIDCFKNLEDEWYIEETLFDTRVPIIKLRHYPTDLKCDISFSNGLACRKSKLVRYYNDAYKMCRELILYLKKWVIFSQLSGTEGISTFTVSWLVIFYLQVKGVLPSVYELIKCQTRSIIIDGWECGYQKNFCITPNDSSFVETLVGLFTFYAEFDYQKYVICPFLGSIIEKEKFATNELPAELTAILNEKNKKAVSLFRFDSPMCMQDPTDLSQNSTKALRKRQLRCFKEYCSSSVDRIISGQQAIGL